MNTIVVNHQSVVLRIVKQTVVCIGGEVKHLYLIYQNEFVRVKLQYHHNIEEVKAPTVIIHL